MTANPTASPISPGEIIPILLGCLRPGADLQALKGLDANEWQALLQQAGRYSLGPLMYQRLMRDHPEGDGIPADAKQALRQSYYKTLQQNMLAYHLLGEVLQRMEWAGIRVLLLKGAYLAEQVYGDVGLRPMGDLDLLVPAEQFQASLDLFHEMGFESERPFFEEADGELHYHAPALTKNDVVIELHWDLVVKSSPVKLDIESLWGRARAIQMENSQAWTLAPEDLLLYLCVHAAYSHEFHGQLRSLIDLMEVMRHFDAQLNWESLGNTAKQWRAERGVYLCLALVEALFAAAPPPQGMALLKPPDWTPKAMAWARQRLFREDRELSASFLRLMSEDLPVRERIQALIYGLLPPRPVMSRIYGFPPGSWRITLRYPVYAAGRIRIYWGNFLRRLKKDPLPAREARSTLSLKEWLQIKN